MPSTTTLRGRLFRSGGLVLVAMALSLASHVARPRAAVAQQPAAKAYVGLFQENAVGVIDTVTQTEVTKIPVPAGPHGMVITPDGRTVYVSSDGDAKVSLIDTATDTVSAQIEVGKAPHGLAMTPDGRLVLAAVFGTSEVAFIDTASNSVIARIPVGSPHNIAIDPSGTRAYVASQQPDAPSLAVIDIPGRVQVATVPLQKVPRALSLTPDGARLFFTLAGDDAVQVLDTAALQVVASVPVGASPHLPLVTPDGEYVLVVVQGPGELAAIDPDTDAVTATVQVGAMPHWIALDGGTAYVTNESSGDVSVVDVETMTVRATIPVGGGPRKIVVQPVPGMGGDSQATPASPASPSASVAPQPATNERVSNGSDDSGTMVHISGFSFMPGTVTIQAGDHVTFVNYDSVTHTSTSADGVWDSGPLQPSSSITVELDQPGTYAYACAIHPFMHGTIVVQ